MSIPSAKKTSATGCTMITFPWIMWIIVEYY